MTSEVNPHHATGIRGMVPEVLFVSDLAIILKLTEEEAEEELRSGALGPFLSLQGRPAALRLDFMQHLKSLTHTHDHRIP